MAAHSTSLGGLRLIGRIVAAGSFAVLVTLGAMAPVRGQPVVPHRIVTVVPAVTEILFAVGAGPQIVGIGSFDTVPAGQTDRVRVGALLDPDLERILALRPDLVVLYASQVEQRQQLERASVSVLPYTHASLADVSVAIRDLARRTGHAERGHEVAQRLERGLEALRARIAGRRRPRTLLVFAREPLSLRNIYASGGVGFLHDMLEAAGGDNVFAYVNEERVAQVGTEIILAAAPEVIIEIRSEGMFDPETSAREQAVWNRLAALPAVRTGSVHLLSGNQFVVPGPRVLDAVEQLARLLHPAAF